MALVTPKYIFIHIYKTGGNTVRNVLRDNISEEVGGFHVEAEYVYKHFLKKGDPFGWKLRTKFAVVRDPYEWVWSLYRFIRVTKHPYTDKTASGFVPFLDFLINDAMKQNRTPDRNKYLTQYDFLHYKGKLLVDHVLKFENLEKEIIKLNKTSLNHAYSVPFVTRYNKTRGENDRTEITEEAREIIYDRFKIDFVTFGYSK